MKTDCLSVDISAAMICAVHGLTQRFEAGRATNPARRAELELRADAAEETARELLRRHYAPEPFTLWLLRQKSRTDLIGVMARDEHLDTDRLPELADLIVRTYPSSYIPVTTHQTRRTPRAPRARQTKGKRP